MDQTKPCTVGSYLIHRLKELGVEHVFGVPGDYVLGFYELLTTTPGIEMVCTCNELGAGYAADAYARVRGLGAACVTYAVGGFSLVNAAAGALAERIPLVIISGGPSLSKRGPEDQLHHTLPDPEAVRRTFEPLCLASTILSDPDQARAEIDRALSLCLEEKGPVYLELPLDLVDPSCPKPEPWAERKGRRADSKVLAEAVEASLEIIGRARRPVVWAGHELGEEGALSALLELLKRTGWPVVSSRQAKGIFPESEDHYQGVYKGQWSQAEIRELVEESEAVLNLGVWPTSVNTGGYSTKLDPARTIQAYQGQVRIGDRAFGPLGLGEFIKALGLALGGWEPAQINAPAFPDQDRPEFQPRPRARLTAARFYERLAGFFRPEHLVLADTGGPMIAMSEVPLPEGTEYMIQGFYLSLGFTVPAGLGAGLAAPARRPVLLAGDGAFQMTGQEVSTMVRQGLSPVIFVLNNDGYQIERIILDGPFNDLQPWKYHLIPELVGGGWGTKVETEGELEEALKKAQAEPDSLALIEVSLERYDLPPAMAKLTGGD